jgi:hypothetical protein
VVYIGVQRVHVEGLTRTGTNTGAPVSAAKECKTSLTDQVACPSDCSWCAVCERDQEECCTIICCWAVAAVSVCRTGQSDRAQQRCREHCVSKQVMLLQQRGFALAYTR